MKARRNQPMLLVDIAVPRDVEPEVGKLANAYLYSVDGSTKLIQHNLAQRKAARCRLKLSLSRKRANLWPGCARKAPARQFVITAANLSRFVMN